VVRRHEESVDVVVLHAGGRHTVSIPVDRRFEVLATHNLVGAVIDAVRRR